MSATLLPPKKYAQLLVSKRIIEYSDATYFGLDTGKRYKPLAALSKILKDSSLARELNPKAAGLRGDILLKYHQAVIPFVDDMFRGPKKESATSDGAVLTSDLGDSVDYTNLRPCRDWMTLDKFMYDIKLECVVDLNFEMWKDELNKFERMAASNMRHAHCELVYDPHSMKAREPVERGGHTIIKVNQYTPPEWRKLERKEDECPDVILRVLKHVFPDAECRKFVLNWLHNMLMRRNETYLILNGAKGCGKGVFTAMAEALVGPEHCAKAPTGLLDSTFNGVLLNNRLIVFDEHIINTDERIAKLKEYANPNLNVEFKNRNALKSMKTYNSYLITNNSIKDMRVEHDDRRYSVADMSDDRLDNTEVSGITPDELQQLMVDLVEDIELQVNWGNYIINHCKSDDYDQFSDWTGARYHKMVKASLSMWKEYIYDTLKAEVKGFEIAHLDMRRKFKRDKDSAAFADINKVEEFLSDFRTEEDEQIGVLLKSEDMGWYIKSYIGVDEEELEAFKEDIL